MVMDAAKIIMRVKTVSEEEIKEALRLDVEVDYGYDDDSDTVQIKLMWKEEVIDTISFCIG